MAGKVPYYYSELQNYSTGKKDQVLSGANQNGNNSNRNMQDQESASGYRKHNFVSGKTYSAVYANEDGIKSVHSPIYEEIREQQNKPKMKIYQKLNPFSNKSSSVVPKRKKRNAPPPPENVDYDKMNGGGEVLNEVQQVHRQHDHTLQSLNLEMENMLMPEENSPPQSCAADDYNGLVWDDYYSSPVTSPSATSTASFHWLPAMLTAGYTQQQLIQQQQDCPFAPSPSSPKTMNEYTFSPQGDFFQQQWRCGTLPQPPPSMMRGENKDVNSTKVSPDKGEPVYMLYDNSHRDGSPSIKQCESQAKNDIKQCESQAKNDIKQQQSTMKHTMSDGDVDECDTNEASLSQRRQAPLPPENCLFNSDGGVVPYDDCRRHDNNIYEDLDANSHSYLPKHMPCDLIYRNGQAEVVNGNELRNGDILDSPNNRTNEKGELENGNCNRHINDQWLSFHSSDSECETCTDSDDDSQAGDHSLAKILDITRKKKKKKKSKDKENENPGGFTRWFSGRKKEYEIGKNKEKLKAKLSLDEETYIDVKIPKKQRHPPPSLPPAPTDLTPEQLKRRYILENIVESENSYVKSLQRLTQDYKKPLEESSPSIVSHNKIQSMFYRVEQIYQCHTIFGMALSLCVNEWDDKEKIGDVFYASFSKSLVLDIYSDFINNFSIAMETARHLVKTKSAFADFLKVKQVTSADRLSFFGLMVKPVQRFPQFILLLQDMLKYTPYGHHDRMSLQLALTQLETLAETLNERKRESEQHYAVTEILKHISAKFSVKPISDGNRFLLRQDNVIQMERGQNGVIVKSKDRRLFLLNDLLVCVSVIKNKNGSFDGSNNERMTLKWAVPLNEVEVLDDPSVTRDLLVSSGWNKITSKTKFHGDTKSLQTLYRDLSNLMHDFEVIGRVTSLVSSLRGSYPDLTTDVTHSISQSIQQAIQQKDEEIAFIDSCCLQLSVPVKSKSGKETAIFQTSSPSIKKEWITDLRLSQLALDHNNMPAWVITDQERPLCRIPLFVSAFPVYSAPYSTEVTCGCYYTEPSLSDREMVTKPTPNYLWLCSSDGVNSHISIMTNNLTQGLRQHDTFHLTEIRVTAMESVPISQHMSNQGWVIQREIVWFGTDSRRIILMGANEQNKQEELGVATVPSPVTHIKYYFDQVFVALTNGMVAIFRRLNDGNWKLKDPHLVLIGQSPVAYLLPVGQFMYAACGRKMIVLNPFYGEIQKSYNVHHEKVGTVNLMAHSGTGLWVALKNSATLCLYHTETFKHLQDINVASNVNRILIEQQHEHVPRLIFVTSLLANRGLLWVGTNVGIVLTIPLPRLEGVPIISGKASVSHHATCSSITFLLALQPRSCQALKFPDADECDLTDNCHDDSNGVYKSRISKQRSDSAIIEPSAMKLRSRLMNRRSMLAEIGSNKSKTLPPGFSLAAAMQLQDSTTDVYGLYGDLFNVTPYAQEGTEPFYETLRRSDPELANSHVTTLDRRVRYGSGRPRSLDLSNWSITDDTDDSALYDSTPLTTDTTMSSNNSSTVLHPGEQHAKATSDQDSGDSTCSVVPEPPVGRCGERVQNKANDKNGQRTILTVMGGSGYVNWKRQADTLRDNLNAHIIVWEMKV